jgi:hypothetical protein
MFGVWHLAFDIRCSPFDVPPFPPREQLLTVVFGWAVVSILPLRVSRQLGEVLMWWGMLTSLLGYLKLFVSDENEMKKKTYLWPKRRCQRLLGPRPGGSRTSGNPTHSCLG